MPADPLPVYVTGGGQMVQASGFPGHGPQVPSFSGPASHQSAGAPQMNLTQYVQLPGGGSAGQVQHQTVTFVDVHGNVLGTAVQPVGGSTGVPQGKPTYVNTGNGVFRAVQMQPQQQQQNIQQAAPLQQQPQPLQPGRGVPRQGTVIQVPAFVQAPPQVLHQQQQLLQVMDVGGGATRIINPMLGNSGKPLNQRGSQQVAVHNGLAPAGVLNQLQVQPARMALPGGASLIRGSSLQQIRPPGGAPAMYTTSLLPQAQGAAPVPVTVVTRPGGAPHVRIPKMTTVATYNPATGIRSSTVMAQPATSGLSAQLPPTMPAHLVQQVQQVNLLTQQQQHQQHAGALAVQGAPAGRMGGPSAMRPALPNGLSLGSAPQAGPNQFVNISLADGTTTTAMVDQATLSRLLNSANNTTVVKVQTPSGQSPVVSVDLTCSGAPQAQPLQLSLPQQNSMGQQPMQMQPSLPIQLQMPVPPTSAAPLDGGNDSLLQAALNMQVQQVQPLYGNQDQAHLGLVGGHGMGPSGKATMSEANVPGSEGQPGASKEDLKAILVSIGHELARNGFSVEEAVAAGWLGSLTASDVAVLADAYAEEERCLTAASFVAAASAQPPAPALAPASAPPVGVVNNDNVLGSSSLSDNGRDAQQQQQQLDALKYGFLGKSTDRLPMHGSDADALEKALGGSNAWHSMADELELSTVDAPGRPARCAVDSASEMEAAKHRGCSVTSKVPDVNSVGGGKNDFVARFAHLDLGCGFY